MPHAAPELDYLLDSRGRVVLALPTGRLRHTMVEILTMVRGERLPWRHLADSVLLHGRGPRAWMLRGGRDGPDIEPGLLLGLPTEHPHHPWLDCTTPSDCFSAVGVVPPVDARAPTWWSTSPLCWFEDGSARSPKIVFTGTIVDLRADVALVESDVIQEWSPHRPHHPSGWVRNTGWAAGDRVAVAVTEGMAWLDAHVRRLADVALPRVGVA